MAFHRSKALGHHRHFLQGIPDHGDGTPRHFRVLLGPKIVEAFQVCK
jgi:hypothetical protein